MIIEFIANGLVNGSLIALLALGFSIIYNTTRVFHIAYAGIYVWAAYLLYAFTEYLQWPLPAAFLAAILGSALLSVICEVTLYAPLIKKNSSHNSLMISSVGMLILLVSLAEILFGNAARYINTELPMAVAGDYLYLSGYRLLILLGSLLFMGVFFLYLNFSSMGIRIRALRDAELLSRVFGVNTRKLKVLLFMLSGMFVALASCLTAIDVGIHPHMGIPVFLNAFVALVIGGIGRFDGPVIGGIFLGIMQALTEYFFDSRWVMLITFILLILFLLIKPRGLVPERSRAF